MNILYHFTSSHGVFAITQSGKFKLSAVTAGSDDQINKGRMFYLSMARTRQNAYSKDTLSAVLELDGTKLKQKYKTAPVDYWQDPKYSESEERILSNKPEIPMWPYLLSLSISLEYMTDMSQLRKIVIACKTRKIPVWLYQTAKDMYLGAPHKRINMSEIDLSVMKKLPQYPESRPRRNDLTNYLAVFHALGTSRLKKVIDGSKPILDLMDSAKRYARYGEFNQIENALRSELNMGLRSTETRRYNSAVALLTLLARKKMTIAQAAKALGEAAQSI